MEIALALVAALALLVGYEFYKKYKANKGNVVEATLELKEEVVAEVKAVEAKAEVAVAEVKKAAKAAAPKVKAAAKKVAAVEEEIVETVKKTTKKPKIKIAK